MSYTVIFSETGEPADDYSTFDTEAEAEEYMYQLMSEARCGAEILNMSNPGDYPYDEDDEFDYYEVIETND